MHASMHPYIHPSIHTDIHTYIHTYACISVYMYIEHLPQRVSKCSSWKGHERTLCWERRLRQDQKNSSAESVLGSKGADKLRKQDINILDDEFHDVSIFGTGKLCKKYRPFCRHHLCESSHVDSHEALGPNPHFWNPSVIRCPMKIEMQCDRSFTPSVLPHGVKSSASWQRPY